MANGNNAANVSVGKPKTGGAFFVAPAKTALPTDATTALSDSFKCLGYISEDGVSQEIETDLEDIKAWGGDTVLNPQTSRSEKFTQTFIEQNADVLKQVYGESNVTVGENGQITVLHNGLEKFEYVYVIETLLTGNRVNRLVIPRGKVIEVGEVVRKDDEAIGYETTISALLDSAGNTAYEHFAEVV